MPSAVPVGSACPSCSEPRQADSRYCQECGYDYGTEAAPPAPPPVPEPSRLSGPILWIVMVIWAVLIVVGVWYLYTQLFVL
jgi:hypothetical protein